MGEQIFQKKILVNFKIYQQKLKTETQGGKDRIR